MRDYSHFHIDGAEEFCLVNVPRRPTHGVRLIAHQNTYGNTNWIAECETAQVADKVLAHHPTVRRADARTLNPIFRQLECRWALVGPAALTLYLPTSHDNGMRYGLLREWLRTNCEDDVCVLSATYERRLSFSSESDYILTKLTLGR